MDKIITYINNKRGGIICLPCGSGKTVMGLYLHCHYKVKTLIVVHKSFLLNQWVERAKQFTDSKIGIIRQNKIDVEGKDIVIGMLQSISTNKYNSDIFKDFGLVIMDEAHHAPSKYFSKSLPIISSNITIGLSATPKRADKTEKILYWFFGEIMHQPEIIKNNNIEVNLVSFSLDNHPKYKEFKLYNGEINRQLTITVDFTKSL
jgi:superfamily II DNA or RNA helicase